MGYNALVKVINKRPVEKTDKPDVHITKAKVLLFFKNERMIKDQSELKEMFTPNGTVFWWDIHEDVNDNDVCWVTLQESAPDKECNYIVQPRARARYAKAIEFLNNNYWNNMQNEIDIRNALVSTGINRTNSDEIYFRFPKRWQNKEKNYQNAWVGPVKLRKDASDKQYRLDKKMILDICIVDDTGIFDIESEHKAFGLSSQVERRVVGYINIQSDEEFTTLLSAGALREFETADNSGINIAITILNKYIEQYTEHHIDAKEAFAFFHRLQTMLSCCSNYEKENEIMRATVKRYFKRVGVIEYQKRVESELLQNFENKNFELTAKLDSIKQKAQERIDQLNTQIKDRENTLEDIQNQHKTEAQQFRDTIYGILEEHRDIFNAISYIFHDSVPRDTNIGKTMTFDIDQFSKVTFEESSKKYDVSKIIKDQSSHFEIDPFVLQLGLLTMAKNKKIPVFTGTAALKTANALAALLSADNVLNVYVPASVFSIYDLFGKPSNQNGMIAELPSRLLSFLHMAHSHPDYRFTAIFEGMNRAPLETYLPPLFDAIFHFEILELEKLDNKEQIIVPYLCWPKNVYVIGTLVKGATTYSMDGEFLEMLELIYSSKTNEDKLENAATSEEQMEFVLNRLRREKIVELMKCEDDIETYESLREESTLLCDDEEWKNKLRNTDINKKIIESLSYNRAFISRLHQ